MSNVYIQQTLDILFIKLFYMFYLTFLLLFLGFIIKSAVILIDHWFKNVIMANNSH